ncbi:MAG: hypothetical protein HQL69_23270 [Magnetococcales bacterium]|nr:hypothetical protein [Magnetococcales bacterium]
MGIIRSKNVILVVVFIVTVFTFPIFFGLIMQQPTENPNFGPIFKNQIAKEKPDYIFIGNSVVLSRIDPQIIAKYTNNSKAYLLVEGNDWSAIWYLKFKNSLIASKHLPKAVFFIFEDDDLTIQNGVSVTARYICKTQRNSLEDEGIFDEILQKNHTPLTLLKYFTAEIYSNCFWNRFASIVSWYIETIQLIFVLPEYAQHHIYNRFNNADIADEQTLNQQDMTEAKNSLINKVNNIFILDNLRDNNQADSHLPKINARMDFSATIDLSFLPHIVQLGKLHNVPMVFVRAQRSPVENNPDRNPQKVAKYVQDLKAYFSEHNIRFYDFSGDSFITADMYKDVSHIKVEYKPAYTKHFIEMFPDIFPNSPTKNTATY